MAFSAMQLDAIGDRRESFLYVETQRYLEFFDLSCTDLWSGSETNCQANRRVAETDLYPSVKRVSLVYEGTLQDRPCIVSSQDAIAFFKEYWTQANASDQERFVVACLDTKNRVQSVVLVTMGTLDASLVHPREVFKPAIIEGSSSILLSHNHPSGNTAPSREDIQVTDRLTSAGELLGIDVLDHIIFGDGSNDAISIRECT